MRLFNIDCHVSVIEDIRKCLTPLGHEITDLSLSAHCHRFDKSPSSVDVIGEGRWKNLDQKMCDKFYEKYQKLLKFYDGFIACYPPAFALLYERFQKPVIAVAATRYEYPCKSNERWTWLNEKLTKGIKEGWIIPLANNLYDKAYCEKFLPETKWEHVPSLCDYVKATHDPRNGLPKSFKVYARQKYWTEEGGTFELSHPSIDKTFHMDAGGKEPPMLAHHIETCLSTAAIHATYNTSVMSAFEHYAMGLPIIVPAKHLMTNWYELGITHGMDPLPVLDQIYFDKGIAKRFGMENFVVENIGLCDWYDHQNMGHVITFDSNDHLRHILDKPSEWFVGISDLMKGDFALKKARVLKQWEGIMRRVK